MWSSCEACAGLFKCWKSPTNPFHHLGVSVKLVHLAMISVMCELDVKEV